jgi:hypothetical protein
MYFGGKHVTSLTRKGISFPDHLNFFLLPPSLVHRWTEAGGVGQMPGYATHLEGVAKASKYLKYGGWVGTAVGGGGVGDEGSGCVFGGK